MTDSALLDENSKLRERLSALTSGFVSIDLDYRDKRKYRWYHNGIAGPTLELAIDAEIVRQQTPRRGC
jgi:hypothetical protein